MTDQPPKSGTRRVAETFVLAIVLAVLGSAVWLMGLIASSRYAEARCYDEFQRHTAYGGLRMETTSWPPMLECQLSGRDLPPLVVQHRLAGVGLWAANDVVPVAYAAGATTALVVWFRRPRSRPSREND